MPFAYEITPHQKSRVKDRCGEGHFGASRKKPGKSYSHQGLDIVIAAGRDVYAPISGEVRTANPDVTYSGIAITGTGEWAGYEVKLFYVKSTVKGSVKAGDIVGQAQDIGNKCNGITNHVHMEVRRNGVLMSPCSIFDTCM